jgi:hypothetical protein
LYRRMEESVKAMLPPLDEAIHRLDERLAGH